MAACIETRYLGPTNSRGACVKATSPWGTTSIAYDDALSVRDNHANVAMTHARDYAVFANHTSLVRHLWICAETKNGYVFINKANADEFSVVFREPK
jgi:hypothetical protein